MSSPDSRSQRELVFCHSCENEWYRDEHGLVCPACRSDVVEIIEADHDPREEMQEEGDFQFISPGGMSFGGGSFGIRSFGANSGEQHVPDADEGDISSFDTSHGSNLHRSVHSPMGQPYTRPPPDPPRAGNAGVADLFTSILRQVGSMSPGEAMQQGQQQNIDARSSSREAPPIPHATRPDPGQLAASASPFQTFQFGNHRVTRYSSHQIYRDGQLISSTVSHHGMPGHGESTNTSQGLPAPGAQTVMFPRDADMSGIMDTMMRALGHGQMQGRATIQIGGNPLGPVIFRRDLGAGQGTEAAAASPLQAIFASLGMGRHHGDFIQSEEELDRIISQLMEGQQSNAPGPANADAINNLPRIKLSKEMIGEGSDTAECGICLTDCEAGEEVTELPCKHWYHFECIKHWLESHDSCPSCRRGIMPQEGDENRPRTTGEPPRNWQMPNLSRSNTHESQGGGNTATRTQSSGSAAERPAQRERSFFSGSRNAPESPPSGQERGSQSLADYLRSGIVGWMGRHLAVGQPTAENPQDVDQARGSARQAHRESSRRTSHTRSRDSNTGLDNPEVD